MKVSKAKFYILGMIIPFLISGCDGNADNRLDLLPIPEIGESFEEESNKLKSQTFDNINFESAYFTFTGVNEVHSFEYKITDFDITADDAYDFMCRKTEELFPGMFSDEEKAQEIKFTDVGVPNEPCTLEQYKALEEKNYPRILTNHPSTKIVRDDCRLEVLNGVMWYYDNGTLASLIDEPRTSDALSAFPVIYRTENLESQEVFHLLDGDISIADAVKSAEEFLFGLELSDRELPFRMRVQNVNVLDVGDDCCAFYFGIVPEYKGIKFDCILPDDSVYGFTFISDNTNERDACGELMMLESDNICRYRYLNLASIYDITNSNKITSILPLKNAAQNVSEYLSSNMRFDALSVSAVNKSFSPYFSTQSIQDDYESYERRVITIKPCWRFVLKPMSGDTRLYYLYVDMVTGDVYNTVQQALSDVEYE